jgi:hypothetical protein
MRWACLIALVTALSFLVLPVAGAVTITANVTPRVVHIGDMVTISGTVNGTPTIAVFLFVMGKSLDPRGVTLENLNIPAGRGMFTTAPVHLNNGSFSYLWDTSVILGTLNPGKYTVYVLDSPVDRQRFTQEEYATPEIEFLPPEHPPTEEPIDPVLPVIALAVAGCVAGMAGRGRV